MGLPKRLYRVTWDAAVGWPYPRDRRETARNYTTAEYAGAQIARILDLPSHLQLKSVHVSDELHWTEVDVAELPVPAPQEDQHDDE